MTIHSLDLLLLLFHVQFCCFTCLQISQEAGQVIWYSHLFKNFPLPGPLTEQRIELHTKGELHTGPSPPRGREAGLWQLEAEGKGLLQSQPQRQHLPTTVSRLLAVFLRSWVVAWFAGRVAAWDQLSWGDKLHTQDPGKWVVGTWEVIKVHSPPGTVRSPSTWSPERLSPGNGTTRPAHRNWARNTSLWEVRSTEACRRALGAADLATALTPP